MSTTEAIRAVKQTLGLAPGVSLRPHRTITYQDTTVYYFTLGDGERVKVVETFGPLTHDVTVVV